MNTPNRFKFRAYNKKLKIIREVAMIEFDDTGRDEIIKVWDHPSTKTAKTKFSISTWLKKDCVILQSTGFTDKKKKEIFGGDIIKKDRGNGDEIFEVRWDNGSFHIIYKDGYYADYLLGHCSSGEIIGNKFTNPELLK